MHDSTELREQVINTCLWLLEKGFVFGTWGNISVKLDNGDILITPTRLAYHLMRPEDLVVIAPDGKIVKGTRRPTSEREVHRGIMNARADVGAVIHMHSPYAMAVCAGDSGIPPLTEEMCQLIGGGVPLTNAFVPSELHGELGEMATRCLRDRNAVLIRNHGPVCCGAALDEARVCCEVVEKSARIYLLLAGDRRMCVIEDQYVVAGRRYYTDAYGKT